MHGASEEIVLRQSQARVPMISRVGRQDIPFLHRGCEEVKISAIRANDEASRQIGINFW